MNNQEILNKLNHVLSMTVLMQKKADEALWEDMIQLEQQRERLLKAVFPLDVTDNAIRGTLEKIVAINQSLGQRCTKEKDKMQKLLQKMNSNKKAVSAYSS